MPLFRVKSVENANFSRWICKNLHRPKKIYMGAARGARDKYEVWVLRTCTKDNIFRKKKLEISGLPTPPYTYICLLRFKKFFSEHLSLGQTKSTGWFF